MGRPGCRAAAHAQNFPGAWMGSSNSLVMYSGCALKKNLAPGMNDAHEMFYSVVSTEDMAQIEMQNTGVNNFHDFDFAVVWLDAFPDAIWTACASKIGTGAVATGFTFNVFDAFPDTVRTACAQNSWMAQGSSPQGTKTTHSRRTGSCT